VRDTFFQLGRTVRDSMLSIPGRLSSLLAAEIDERRIHSTLKDELLKTLICLKEPYPEEPDSVHEADL